jgi:hypothetical protein
VHVKRHAVIAQATLIDKSPMHTLCAVELNFEQVEVLGNTPTETARYFALFCNKISGSSISSGSAALKLAASSPFDRWCSAPDKAVDELIGEYSDINTAADR